MKMGRTTGIREDDLLHLTLMVQDLIFWPSRWWHLGIAISDGVIMRA